MKTEKEVRAILKEQEDLLVIAEANDSDYVNDIMCHIETLELILEIGFHEKKGGKPIRKTDVALVENKNYLVVDTLAMSKSPLTYLKTKCRDAS